MLLALVAEEQDLAAVLGGVRHDRVLAGAQDGDAIALGDGLDRVEHAPAVILTEAVAQLVEDEHAATRVRAREQSSEHQVHAEQLLLRRVRGVVVRQHRAADRPPPSWCHLPLPGVAGSGRPDDVPAKVGTETAGFPVKAVEGRADVSEAVLDARLHRILDVRKSFAQTAELTVHVLLLRCPLGTQCLDGLLGLLVAIAELVQPCLQRGGKDVEAPLLAVVGVEPYPGTLLHRALDLQFSGALAGLLVDRQREQDLVQGTVRVDGQGVPGSPLNAVPGRRTRLVAAVDFKHMVSRPPESCARLLRGAGETADPVVQPLVRQRLGRPS